VPAPAAGRAAGGRWQTARPQPQRAHLRRFPAPAAAPDCPGLPPDCPHPGPAPPPAAPPPTPARAAAPPARAPLPPAQVEAKKAVPKEETPPPPPGGGDGGAPQKTRKIFVGGLAPSVDDAVLRTYFEAFGPVEDAVVMYDHDNKRPRGFGFITFAEEGSVDKVFEQGAMQNIHDKQVRGATAAARGEWVLGLE
jgi:hypothetical protein